MCHLFWWMKGMPKTIQDFFLVWLPHEISRAFTHPHPLRQPTRPSTLPQQRKKGNVGISSSFQRKGRSENKEQPRKKVPRKNSWPRKVARMDVLPSLAQAQTRSSVAACTSKIDVVWTSCPVRGRIASLPRQSTGRRFTVDSEANLRVDSHSCICTLG